MKSVEIIRNFNKILKPISDLIIFLFTTKLGIFILILIFLLYLYLSVYNRIKGRKLLYEAASGEEKLPWQDLWIFIGADTIRFGNIFVIAAVLLGIVGLSNTFSSVTNFVDNQKRIKELSITVKNLNQRYKVAKVEVLNYNLRKDSTTLKVSFYDYAKNGLAPKNQIIKLHGHNIYFVTYVMNFKYSLIENGSQINIAIPYLIFSEKMDEQHGIKLHFADSTGIPFIFHRNKEELYGIKQKEYNERMKEIVKYMYDEKAAREAGIKSRYDSSPHYVKALQKGQVFYIWVEQTGGLVIKQEEQW
jgi:hypothetical protein